MADVLDKSAEGQLPSIELNVFDAFDGFAGNFDPVIFEPIDFLTSFSVPLGDYIWEGNQ